MTTENKSEQAPPFEFTVVEDKGDEVVIEISEESYQRDLAAGLAPEETLKPGKYVGKRGGFLERHPNFKGSFHKDTKIRVAINLDGDILHYFRMRAQRETADAESYRKLINDELRCVMEREIETRLSPIARELLNDERFLNALKEKLRDKENAEDLRREAA